MTIQNPYLLLDTKIKTALDYIINHLPLSPTFQNLNDTLVDAVFAGTPPTDDMITLYVKSVLPNVYNSYLTLGPSPLRRGMPDGNTPNASLQDGSLGARGCSAPLPEGEGAGVRSYTENQLQIITTLLNTIRNTAPESIPQLLAATDEKIAASGLSFAEQTPLFVATVTGKAVYEYWLLNIPQPGTWAAYMVNPNITPQAMDAVNYAAVNSWVSAAMEGALLGYGSIHLPKIDFVDMMAAYIAATGMAAGKVVFKW